MNTGLGVVGMGGLDDEVGEGDREWRLRSGRSNSDSEGENMSINDWRCSGLRTGASEEERLGGIIGMGSGESYMAFGWDWADEEGYIVLDMLMRGSMVEAGPWVVVVVVEE